MEAKTPSLLLYIYTSENIFIALGWRYYVFMNILTYQDREYIIRAMNIHSAGNQTLVFLLQAARTIALCHSENICDQVA